MIDGPGNQAKLGIMSAELQPIIINQSLLRLCQVCLQQSNQSYIAKLYWVDQHPVPMVLRR